MNNYILFEYNNKMYKYDINYFAFCKKVNHNIQYQYIKISIMNIKNVNNFFNIIGRQRAKYFELDELMISYNNKKYKFNAVVFGWNFMYYNKIEYIDYIIMNNFDNYLLEKL